MATASPRFIGRTDDGLRVSFEDFIAADFEEGGLYELARGVVVVTEVPNLTHGRIVERLSSLFVLYGTANPRRIEFRSNRASCSVRLPRLQSCRQPDQAIYLLPPPPGEHPWIRWTPQIVVEVLGPGSESRDLIEKRQDYLLVGATEYWIVDPDPRRMHALRRAGDTWDEAIVPAHQVYRTHLLPGLDVRPADLFADL